MISSRWRTGGRRSIDVPGICLSSTYCYGEESNGPRSSYNDAKSDLYFLISELLEFDVARSPNLGVTSGSGEICSTMDPERTIARAESRKYCCRSHSRCERSQARRRGLPPHCRGDGRF